MARLEDVMAPGYLEGLQTWTMDDVRLRRDEATEVETGLSYFRRLIQARLDIVDAERGARESGAPPTDQGDLVQRLPEILGVHVQSPGIGHLPSLIAPGEVDAELRAQMEDALPASKVAALGQMNDSDLEAAATALGALERSVSAQRRAVFDVVDRIKEELVRRYRTGEASVDSLLP